MTIEQARAKLPYVLPVPRTDESTGQRWGVWVLGDDVAFLWESSLRFYAEPTEMSVKRVARSWARKAKQEPELWHLLEVRGHRAIGLSSETSSLTWVEDGLTLQLVSDSHSLAELRDIARGIVR